MTLLKRLWREYWDWYEKHDANDDEEDRLSRLW